MSVSDPVKTWTCDRCGKQVVLSMSEQPLGWRGLVTTKQPLADPSESKERRHVCGTCAAALDQWFWNGVHEASREVTDGG